MTVLTALFAEATEDDLRQAAALLQPYLPRQAPIEDRWLRGAKQIAEYIDAPPSRVFALSSTGRLPVRRDGSNLVARTSELDAWITAGGAKRP